MSLLQVNAAKSSADSDAVHSRKATEITVDPPTNSTIEESNETTMSSIKQSEQSVLSESLAVSDNFEHEEIHNVSFVVTICAAFPADDVKEVVQDTATNKPRATEGPKPQVENKQQQNWTGLLQSFLKKILV